MSERSCRLLTLIVLFGLATTSAGVPPHLGHAVEELLQPGKTVRVRGVGPRDVNRIGDAILEAIDSLAAR